MIRAAFHTLGCKVNHYETEAIKEAFVSRGAKIAEEGSFADIYVINTCSVTNIADRKSRQFIRRARRINPEAVIVVTGCYAQTAPDEVEAMEEVDLVIGNSLKNEIADKALRLYELGRAAGAATAGANSEAGGAATAGANSKAGAASAGANSEAGGAASAGAAKDAAAYDELPRSRVLSFEELTDYEDMGIVSYEESQRCRAYIKIEEGCNRFCSYCLIPYARGRVRSRRPDDIVREAKLLIGKGCREIVLTGINTALYGTEPGFSYERLEGEDGLSGLEMIVRRLDALEGDFRIRLSSLEPTVVNRDDVVKLLGYSKLCHHLHLSVQSGSDRILGAMNRHYTKEDYLGIVDAIRDFDPLYGITTDIIVGFPGETEEDFRESLDVTERSLFGKVHVFRYSPRRGTPGERMPDAVPGDVKNERADRLEELAERVAEDFRAAHRGRRERVLVEEIRDGFAEGYTGSYIKVYIDCGKAAAGSAERSDTANMNAGKADRACPEPGEFCDVVIGEAYKDGCIAEQC